jgi:hypothetical protein
VESILLKRRAQLIDESRGQKPRETASSNPFATNDASGPCIHGFIGKAKPRFGRS